jgi:hypothetical protein
LRYLIAKSFLVAGPESRPRSVRLTFSLRTQNGP